MTGPHVTWSRSMELSARFSQAGAIRGSTLDTLVAKEGSRTTVGAHEGANPPPYTFVNTRVPLPLPVSGVALPPLTAEGNKTAVGGATRTLQVW